MGVFAILQWYYWPRALTRELGKISPGLVPQYEKQLDEASQTDLFIYYGYMTPDVTLRLDNTPISIERFWEEVKETTVWRRSREDFFSHDVIAMPTPLRFFLRIHTDESCELWIYVSDRDEISVHGSYKDGRAIRRSWVDVSHSFYKRLYKEAFSDADAS